MTDKDKTKETTEESKDPNIVQDMPNNVIEVLSILLVITPLLIRFAIKPTILISNFIEALVKLKKYLPWVSIKNNKNLVCNLDKHQKHKLKEKIITMTDSLQLNWCLVGCLHNGEISPYGYHFTRVKWECIYPRKREPPWKLLDDAEIISRKAYQILINENTRPDYILNEYIYHLPIYRDNVILGVITIGFTNINSQCFKDLNEHVYDIRKFIDDCVF